MEVVLSLYHYYCFFQFPSRQHLEKRPQSNWSSQAYQVNTGLTSSMYQQRIKPKHMGLLPHSLHTDIECGVNDAFVENITVFV
eukprot:403347063